MTEPFDIGRSCGGEALLFKQGESHDFAIVRNPEDAPLLAAAPAMLAALRTAADALSPPRNCEESAALRTVNAAIYTATESQP